MFDGEKDICHYSMPHLLTAAVHTCYRKVLAEKSNEKLNESTLAHTKSTNETYTTK